MDNYFPPPDSAGGWRTLKDAKGLRQKAGVDKTRLEQAWEQCQRCSANSGLVIVRRGWLVSENYAGRASRMCNPDMASTGKCFTSIACGIMLKEFRDKIPQGLDTKVFTREFLPEAFPLDDPRKAEITLGQLLCMSAGFHGEGSSPGFADGKIVPLTPVPGQDIRDVDGSSLRTPLWCDPGKGYSYSSPAPHIASMVLRRVTGMELREYIDTRLAKPQGWGAWDYCLQRGDFLMPHANGAGSTALHATDAVRFAYCLARGGKWAGKQLVPPEYLALCNKMLPYNPHAPFSLQFEHNADGHVAGAPRDAFWKSGAGGFCLYVVPSLDLVLYKMGGGNFQYDPSYTKIPQPPQDTSRDNWKPTPRSLFHDGTLGGDDGLRRVLEMACAAIVD
ncbi:serine hydrolase domain-containing protein [Armatimonas rosea]|uniref:CubicO group peptidase (Beta-lactamase class C family) n=1 Tax=Armatimonas rosea TaxID=685828 RepID=A0A7W9W9F8_ARMRO|nr:serine hydrolase domain-containing protein [Armatimonas rosea]MBB6053160.1 CubicO group peptidase (beta-lactamase class C family) [Armatimonas rosea]